MSKQGDEELDVRIKAVVECALGIGLLHGREGEGSGRAGIDECATCSEALAEDIADLRACIENIRQRSA